LFDGIGGYIATCYMIEHNKVVHFTTGRIIDVDNQIIELKRKEINLLRISAESQEVSPDALDTVLSENHNSQEALRNYKTKLC
jgi:hypothetical protein